MKLSKLTLLSIIVCITFTSCIDNHDVSISNSLQQLIFIDVKDMFSPSVYESKYLVLFYSPTCNACITVNEILDKRYEKKPFPIYKVNISNYEIERVNSFYSNIGVSDYKNIKLYSTPYLVIIEEGVIIEEFRGLKEIQNLDVYGKI